MIAVFAAMEPEVTACLGCFAEREETTIAGYPAVACDIAVVCRTGIGPRSRQCVEAALPQVQANAVLSVGTAGGLHRDRVAGDIIVCRRVDHAKARGAPADLPSAMSDPGLVDAAMSVAKQLGLPARIGACVTVDTVAWTPEEKADLHGWLGHDVVEMESYWIGRAAAKHGLPFVAIRVVTDQAGDLLSELAGSAAVSEDGVVDPLAFQAFIRERPELMPVLAEQVKRGSIGLGHLSRFLGGFIPHVAEMAL